MQLWILAPVKGLPQGDNPWDPWYDKAFGFTVLAETEAEARALADADAGDENRGEFLSKKIANTQHPWLDPKYSTCEPFEPTGKARVVMRDFASA